MSALVLEEVADGGDVIVVRARMRDVAVACPGCGMRTARVHGYPGRTVADMPVGGPQGRVRPGAAILPVTVGGTAAPTCSPWPAPA